MKSLSRKIITFFTLVAFIFQPVTFAADVLVDSGQRQTVVERTKQYAGRIDALDIRSNATLNFQKNLKVHAGNSTAGASDKCGGYTVSACGTPCCGKKECESVCSANMSVAHGNTCLSDYTTSWCGMSCCGKEDCDRVCYNYRTTTASYDNCGGYIKTATGESCCGLEDCRNKNCGNFTSTISADFGIEQKCCGEKNCLDVKCDYNHSTEVISGGTAKCCGTKDCYSKYCEEMTSVDSKVYPEKKNLACCGKVNCHEVECDGYTQTNTPSGIRSCCGYEDCRDKECQYRRSAKNDKGQIIACCGIEECGNIESKTWEGPINKKAYGPSKSLAILVHSCNDDSGDSASCTPSRDWNYYAYRTVANKGTATHKTGLSTKIPSGCNQTSVETYDGINYYHYDCVSQIQAKDNVTLYKYTRSYSYGAIVDGYSTRKASNRDYDRYEYDRTNSEGFKVDVNVGGIHKMTYFCARWQVKYRGNVIATYDICSPSFSFHESLPSWVTTISQKALISFGNRH